MLLPAEPALRGDRNDGQTGDNDQTPMHTNLQLPPAPQRQRDVTENEQDATHKSIVQSIRRRARYYDRSEMRSLLLGLVFVGGVLRAQAGAQSPPQGLQVQPPVFRGGVSVVPVGLPLEYNQKPWVGLTSADSHVLLDKTELALLEVVHDECRESCQELLANSRKACGNCNSVEIVS